MDYNEFVEYIDNLLKSHRFTADDMTRLYRKGYTACSEEEKKWICEFNARETGSESDILSADVLCVTKKKKNENGENEMEYTSLKEVYEDSQKHTEQSGIPPVSLHVFDIKTAERILAASFEEIKDRLIIRPLNYWLHKRDLKGAIYKKYDDIVLAVYQKLDLYDGVLSSKKILRTDLERWDMVGREEEVFQAALLNSQRLDRACVCDKHTMRESDFLNGSFTKDDISLVKGKILLSTFRSTNGAAAFFYPGVADKMLEIMGGEFTVVFMNVNDVMIFEKNDPFAVYAAKAAGDSTGIAEMLSGKCYRYDGKKLYAVKS